MRFRPVQRREGTGEGEKLSPLRAVAAILCADVHLSARAPLARSGEGDWIASQARVLAELSRLCLLHRATLVIAGDVFDRWNAPPEVINLALEHLPRPCYAVPGQHDLPYHLRGQSHRSAYGTLIRAGAVHDLLPGEPRELDAVVLHGFPWGTSPTPCPERHDLDGRPHVAIVHGYCWAKGREHPGATPEQHYRSWRDALPGYDLRMFGDNHAGFLKPGVLNCGTLMRRRSDEVDYRPRVGLLGTDGKVELHYLDVEHESFSAAEPVAEKTGFRGLLHELETLEGGGLDFRRSVGLEMEKRRTGSAVKTLVSRCLED